jgi:hypothetical protein
VSSDNWGTPAFLVELARGLLGTIDLDPCSTAVDNEVIQASHFYTEQDDGLVQPWSGTVLCNPPGGNSKLVKAFWAKCVAHPAPVFWVGFNLGQLRYLQPSPLGFRCAILRKRVQFRDPEGKGRTAGRYDNYIALLHSQRHADDFYAAVKPLASWESVYGCQA